MIDIGDQAVQEDRPGRRNRVHPETRDWQGSGGPGEKVEAQIQLTLKRRRSWIFIRFGLTESIIQVKKDQLRHLQSDPSGQFVTDQFMIRAFSLVRLPETSAHRKPSSASDNGRQ